MKQTLVCLVKFCEIFQTTNTLNKQIIICFMKVLKNPPNLDHVKQTIVCLVTFLKYPLNKHLKQIIHCLIKL